MCESRGGKRIMVETVKHGTKKWTAKEFAQALVSLKKKKQTPLRSLVRQTLNYFNESQIFFPSTAGHMGVAYWIDGLTGWESD